MPAEVIINCSKCDNRQYFDIDSHLSNVPCRYCGGKIIIQPQEILLIESLLRKPATTNFNFGPGGKLVAGGFGWAGNRLHAFTKIILASDVVVDLEKELQYLTQLCNQLQTIFNENNSKDVELGWQKVLDHLNKINGEISELIKKYDRIPPVLEKAKQGNENPYSNSIDENRRKFLKKWVTVGAGGVVAGKLLTEDQQLKIALKKLKKGYFNFAAPDYMKVDKQEIIAVEIFRNQDLLELIQDKKYLEEIKVAQVMKVKLEGTDFEIKPINTEQQIVDQYDKSQWQWLVKPLRSGTRSMNVTVSALLKIDGSDRMKDYPIYTKDIKVKINVRYSAKRFASNNWQWLTGAFLGTGMIWKWHDLITTIRHLFNK